MVENPLHSSHPRTTEEHREQEKGQNVKEHEVFRPCFLGSCTDGLPDNVLIVEGRRWPLIPDHCGCGIDVMPSFFFHACPVHAPLPPRFVRQPCSQEPSLGVPNGMLAVLSIVSVPYVCVCVTAYICMNEK